MLFCKTFKCAINKINLENLVYDQRDFEINCKLPHRVLSGILAWVWPSIGKS